MDPKELEAFTNQLYDEGLTDEEVAAKVSELEAASPAPAAPAAKAPSGGQSLFDAKTLFPGTVAAINAGPSPGDSAMVQSQLDIQKAAPMSFNMVPGGSGMPMPIVSDQSMKAGVAAVGDWFGKGFRLAGSLIPSKLTRGTVKDEATGQDRNRTFTEAMQNPNTSLTTQIDQNLENSNLPAPVKFIGHAVLGLGQGLGAGVAEGGAKAVVAKSTAGLREGTGNAAVRVADAVQNLRLGATPKDVLDGYSPRTLARNGLNRLAPADAWRQNEEAFARLNQQARAIKGAETATLDVNQVLNNTRDELMSKKYDFNRQQVSDALDRIQATIADQAERDGIQLSARQPFVPRRPIFQLTPEEIQNGIANGEIRFATRGNRAVPEYARPEQVPENFLPAEGAAPELRLNLMDLNTLKTEVGKQAAFHHIAGRVRADQAASAAEKAFNTFYSKLKTASDQIGGPELQAINRQFSELIPVQNVLARAMTREELGAALGRTDIPTTKLGLVRTLMKATRTDRMAGLNAAGEALQQSGAADAAQPFMQSVGTRAAEAALNRGATGVLAGSLRR
jgi:hypothetical protein